MTATPAAPRLGVAALVAGIVMTCAAFGGSVVTTDGRRIEGVVSLEPGPAVAVLAKGDRRLTFPLDHVVEADLINTPAAAAATRPAPWTSVDVGSVNAAGSTAQSNGRFELMGGGRASREEKGGDSLHFHCQRLPGDGQIVARLRTFDEPRGVRAGIMIRESLDAHAPFAAVVRQALQEPTQLRIRKQQGEESAVADAGDQIILGATWLKLERRGSVFSAFQSTDGKTWWSVGQAAVPMLAETPAYVGLFSASSKGILGQKTVFDNVWVTLTGEGSAALHPAGVMMRSGSLLAGQVLRADDSTVTLRRGAGESAIPAAQAAWLLLRPMPGQMLAKMDQPRAGVLLRSEDFIEGELKHLDSATVKLNSLLFGVKSFEIGREAIGVVLRSPAPAGDLRVTLDDGSVLRAAALTVSQDQMMAGDVKVLRAQVVGIRRATGPASRPGN